MDILLPFEYLLYLTVNVIRNVLLDDPDESHNAKRICPTIKSSDIPQVLLVVLTSLDVFPSP